MSQFTAILLVCVGGAESAAPIEPTASHKPARSQSEEYRLTPDEQQLIDWYDTLGFPDLTKRAYVRAMTFSIKEYGSDELKDYSYSNAFVLKQQHDSFEIFTLNLSTHNIDSAPAWQLPTLKVLNLRTEVEKLLQQIRDPQEGVDTWEHFGYGASRRLQLFILARGCAGRGLNGLAHELITEAARMLDSTTTEVVGLDGLAAALSNEIATRSLLSHVEAFADTSLNRAQLVALFQDFIKKFPENPRVEQAKRTVKTLQLMIEEDAEYRKRPPKTSAQMTVDERVVELISQLRDHHVPWLESPFPSTMVVDFRERGPFRELLHNGTSPASQLAQIGNPALERLIGSSDDERFTRSIEFSGDRRFPRRVVRVGEVCRMIIQRIEPTGREFDFDADPGVAKRAMKMWYLGGSPPAR